MSKYIGFVIGTFVAMSGLVYGILSGDRVVFPNVFFIGVLLIILSSFVHVLRVDDSANPKLNKKGLLIMISGFLVALLGGLISHWTAADETTSDVSFFIGFGIFAYGIGSSIIKIISRKLPGSE